MKSNNFFYIVLMCISSLAYGMESMVEKIRDLQEKRIIETANIQDRQQTLSIIRKIQRNPYLFSERFQASGYYSEVAYSKELDARVEDLTNYIIRHQKYKNKIEKEIARLQRVIDQEKGKKSSAKSSRI